MYLSHFIAKLGTIFNIYFKQGTQFCSACSSSGLIYHTMDLEIGHLEERYHAQIILLLLFTMKIFVLFSESILPKNCIFFCVLAYENQEAFSERCSLIKGVL